MLFKLRYRKPFGAVDDLVDAADLAQADAVGRLYCEQQAGYKFISVTAAVVATALILQPEGQALPTEATKKARVGA